MALNREDQDYYEGLLEMFGTSGWRSFIEDHESALNTLRDSAYVDCADNNSWQERRGEINKLIHIMNYEGFIRTAYISIQGEDEMEKQYTEGLH